MLKSISTNSIMGNLALSKQGLSSIDRILRAAYPRDVLVIMLHSPGALPDQSTSHLSR